MDRINPVFKIILCLAIQVIIVIIVATWIKPTPPNDSSISTSDSTTPKISVTYEEYYAIDGDIYESIRKSSAGTICSAGVWEDGTFFIDFNRKINIYDANGTYLHTLEYNGLDGGSVYVGAVGEDELELLHIRPDYLQRIKRTGEVIGGYYLSEEEDDAKKEELTQIKRGLFKTKTLYLGDENQPVIKIPPYLTAPNLPNSYLEVYSSDAADAECLYSDEGMSVYVQYTAMAFVALLALVFTVAILIKRRC
ncbi:MAG: hypothetical protein E7617_00680 [Ruminococcaceae bacterium]|nr:hypothetical protein [Oscillospiraceae bacterium]